MSTLHQEVVRRRAEEADEVSFVTARERQLSLVVSPWTGESWVLSWSQFARAYVDRERIDLVFGDSLVVVTGRNLRTLLDAIASHRLSVLRELPPEYRGEPGAGEAFVSAVEVTPEAAGASAALESPA